MAVVYSLATKERVNRVLHWVFSAKKPG